MLELAFARLFIVYFFMWYMHHDMHCCGNGHCLKRKLSVRSAVGMAVAVTSLQPTAQARNFPARSSDSSLLVCVSSKIKTWQPKYVTFCIVWSICCVLSHCMGYNKAMVCFFFVCGRRLQEAMPPSLPNGSHVWVVFTGHAFPTKNSFSHLENIHRICVFSASVIAGYHFY